MSCVPGSADLQIGCRAGLQTRAISSSKHVKFPHRKKSGDVDVSATAGLETGATFMRRYMIAVGGAGSSGLPAFASGTRTITIARITSMMNPATTGGCCRITGKGHCL